MPSAAAAMIVGALLMSPAAATASPACDGAGSVCSNGLSTAPGTVDVAAGDTLTVRRKPRANAQKVRELADGARVTIVCQTQSESVAGTFGSSRLWDKLKAGGFVSDTFISTGTDGRVAPECPSATKPHPKPRPNPQDRSRARPRSVVLHDDYPYKTSSPESADPWGFYFRECTGFVAYRLNRLKKFSFSNLMDGGHYGDAGNWDDNARDLGIGINRHPTVGSVMVRDSGTWGHVAIVAKVTATRFLVEEYNHEVDHGYSQRWISRSPNADWSRFIHFRT